MGKGGSRFPEGVVKVRTSRHLKVDDPVHLNEFILVIIIINTLVLIPPGAFAPRPPSRQSSLFTLLPSTHAITAWVSLP